MSGGLTPCRQLRPSSRREHGLVWFRGLTPQQQPGSYQGGEMMMKSVFWWRKPEHPEETTDLRQVTDENMLKLQKSGTKNKQTTTKVVC